jgi:hypothetical protein
MRTQIEYVLRQLDSCLGTEEHNPMPRTCSTGTFLLLLVVISAAVFPVLGQNKSKEPIKVYVFYQSNSSGFVDSGEAARRDTANDIANSLKHNKMIQVLGDEEKNAADVTVEIVSRGYEAGTSDSTLAVVRTVLRHGDYSTQITGWINPANGGLREAFSPWRLAADKAAASIEHWIKTNHDRLIDSRPSAH